MSWNCYCLRYCKQNREKELHHFYIRELKYSIINKKCIICNEYLNKKFIVCKECNNEITHLLCITKLLEEDDKYIIKCPNCETKK